MASRAATLFSAPCSSADPACPPGPAAQVVGAAQERVMAANQRGQGEERRMFVSPQVRAEAGPGCAGWAPPCATHAELAHAGSFTPQMLQVLLRMRQLEAMVGDSEEEGEEAGSSGDEEQDGVGGGRRRRGPPGGDCSIM